MLCNICGKNEATIHVKSIVNTHMVKMHICESCAKEKGVDLAFDKNPFSIADVLQGLTGLEGISHTRKKERQRCPLCKTGYDDFKSSGKFGCSRCYRAFRSSIEPLLKRIHGSIEHTGKKYKKESSFFAAESKGYLLRKFHAELAEAVKTERYEKAAELRDRIRLLDGKKGP